MNTVKTKVTCLFLPLQNGNGHSNSDLHLLDEMMHNGGSKADTTEDIQDLPSPKDRPNPPISELTLKKKR